MNQGFFKKFCSACFKYKSLHADYAVILHIQFNGGSLLIVEETEITMDELRLVLLAQSPTILESFGIQSPSNPFGAFSGLYTGVLHRENFSSKQPHTMAISIWDLKSTKNCSVNFCIEFAQSITVLTLQKRK